jgi:hypothetical protein
MKIQLKTTVLWKLPKHNLYTRHFLDAIEGLFSFCLLLRYRNKKDKKKEENVDLYVCLSEWKWSVCVL